MNRFGLSALALLSLGAAFALPGLASATPLAQAGNHSMCLSASGGALGLSACNGQAGEDVVGNGYGMQNVAGRCLDQQPDPSFTGGKTLMLNNCTGGTSQKWTFDASNGQLRNELGWCVDSNSLRTAKCNIAAGWTRSVSMASAGSSMQIAPAGQMTVASTQVAMSRLMLSSAAIAALNSGKTVVVDKAGNLVAAGGGNIVAPAGTYKLVAAGGGNLVAAGGGNLADLIRH